MGYRTVTVEEAKRLGVWSKFCKQEGWKEERLEARGLRADMEFLIDEELFKNKPIWECPVCGKPIHDMEQYNEETKDVSYGFEYVVEHKEEHCVTAMIELMGGIS